MAQHAEAEGRAGELTTSPDAGRVLANPTSRSGDRSHGVEGAAVTRERLQDALRLARRELLSRRQPAGFWEGELSSSALSTATALSALALAAEAEDGSLIATGVRWLANHQNTDGGWGDTVDSPSNLATTLLCFSALTLNDRAEGALEALTRAAPYVSARTGSSPAERAAAIAAAYGEDRTFAVPILMNCALAGLVEWADIPSLPCELAVLPQSWYRLMKLQVVSYALPALIAVGLALHHHRRPFRRGWSPLRVWTARAIMRKLVTLQPITGGFLEATPLTAFVCMALQSFDPGESHEAARVLSVGLDFLRRSRRPDGSWPIDTNLSTWVTSSAVNALELSGGQPRAETEQTLNWLADRQYRQVHPYTGAAPGGFGWTHLPGGVPDADDTSGALLALCEWPGFTGREAALQWLLALQNDDGGWPTFCRGWGKLPFDQSCDDLTAHALRALRKAGVSSREMARALSRGLDYLSARQRRDGSWVPLWFGNQHAPQQKNPVLGTARVLLAWAEVDRNAEEALQGLQYLVSVQNPDGGWGGAAEVPSTIEETALALSALAQWPQECRIALQRGLHYLVSRVENANWTEPAPVGLYFASLWYSEALYPIVWTVEALGRALSSYTA